MSGFDRKRQMYIFPGSLLKAELERSTTTAQLAFVGVVCDPAATSTVTAASLTPAHID